MSYFHLKRVTLTKVGLTSGDKSELISCKHDLHVFKIMLYVGNCLKAVMTKVSQVSIFDVLLFRNLELFFVLRSTKTIIVISLISTHLSVQEIVIECN